jgi:hypothetical protein
VGILHGCDFETLHPIYAIKTLNTSIIMLLVPQDISTEYLQQELAAAEKELRVLEKRQQQSQQKLSLGEDGGSDCGDSSISVPKSVKLAKLQQQADSLELAHALSQWSMQAPEDVSEDPTSSLMAQAKWCRDLASLLMRYSDHSTFQDTYVPLYEYLYPSLLALVRQELAHQTTDVLIHQCEKEPQTCCFPQACYWLSQMQRAHQALLQDDSIDQSPAMAIVKELLRPFLKRVAFHFVEPSPERVTTNRVDRLPEWLLIYLRENLLEQGPHPLIQRGLSIVLVDDASELNLCFWQELVRIVEWVFLQRQFMRHLEICGPRSNPILLYNAIEQFLLFDRSLRESVGHEVYGLMDTLVMADDELQQWFLEREREAVFSTFLQDDTNVPKPLANHVSPRAEIFCAIIRAVQWKASILAEPGLYLRHVAVPLCSQFVDALQERSTDLRYLLCQPSSIDLAANLNEWIEIINGTRLAARVLLKEGAWQDGMPAASQSDHDLARFGRSLERLVDVLVEEFALSFVETILMERTKFASYLMMSSHLLASRDWDGDDQDLSAELKETRSVLLILHQVCYSILDVPDEGQFEEESSLERLTAQFAPRAIQRHVMTRVADKFLEVVLDTHDMTPDLYLLGSEVFSRDVESLVGEFSDLPLVKRLLDITALLTSKSVDGLVDALGGLVGASSFLDIHDFTSDDKIYDEAVMMLQAKGFSHLELKDAISVLNRRRD